MTDEEKKSIELLKDFEYRSKTENYNKITLEDVLNVKIILNLIENQQKEIEKLKHDLYYKQSMIDELTQLEVEHKMENGKLREEIGEIEERLQESINEKCVLKTELYANSISKSKIEEKIEEYNDFFKRNPEAYRKGHCRVAVVVLKELLESE